MQTLKLSLVAAAAAALSMAGAAHAQDDGGPTVSFNVGAASDYVFRGASQTDEDPQVFGGVDLTMGRFYAGTWASNVDFSDSTDAEIDVYAGFKPTLGPVSLDLAAIYYGYVDAPSGSDYAYFEFKAAGSMPLGKASLGAAVYYSPDFFGVVDDAFYYEVNGSYPLTDKLSVSGALGRQELEGPGDYTTWNLGLGFALNSHLGVDVRYHDSSVHEFGKLYDSRGVVSLKATF
jgi:uncharacterized protein (TIGR02001 family)